VPANVAPDAAEVFTLAESGQMEGAFNAGYAALKKDPVRMDLLEAMAFCFMKIDQWPLAYHLLHYVKDKVGPAPALLNNLAMNCSSLASCTGKDDFLDEAEKHLRKAWHKVENGPAEINEIKGAVADNLALSLVHKGEIREAVKFADIGLKIDPNRNGLRETLGYAQLMQGKFGEGFTNYEFAVGGKYRKPRPFGEEPYWTGEKGGTLLLHGEQGIWDEISYASVIPDASKDNRIIYECDKRLEGLMKRSLPGVEVHGTRFAERTWDASPDWNALTGSLCRVYRPTGESFPRRGYLLPDPERVLQWRALLASLPGRKVGIAWTGGLPNTFRSRRSFNLEGLLPILKLPGITWVSLQYKDPTAEIAEFTAKHGIEIKHWERAVGKGADYDDTAALESELDCVVTVTTAIAHLAGALGKKALVLVPKRCRWFYCSDDNNHRWYESLEMFRQENKWPVERVAERLRCL